MVQVAETVEAPWAEDPERRGWPGSSAPGHQDGRCGHGRQANHVLHF